VGIAQRARHPEELKRDPDKYMIDIEYYLSQQVLPHCDIFFLFEKSAVAFPYDIFTHCF
jgi:DNA polymerase elongation subunit (family B)